MAGDQGLGREVGPSPSRGESAARGSDARYRIGLALAAPGSLCLLAAWGVAIYSAVDSMGMEARTDRRLVTTSTVMFAVSGVLGLAATCLIACSRRPAWMKILAGLVPVLLTLHLFWLIAWWLSQALSS